MPPLLLDLSVGCQCHTVAGIVEDALELQASLFPAHLASAVAPRPGPIQRRRVLEVEAVAPGICHDDTETTLGDEQGIDADGDAVPLRVDGSGDVHGPVPEPVTACDDSMPEIEPLVDGREVLEVETAMRMATLIRVFEADLGERKQVRVAAKPCAGRARSPSRKHERATGRIEGDGSIGEGVALRVGLAVPRPAGEGLRRDPLGVVGPAHRLKTRDVNGESELAVADGEGRAWIHPADAGCIPIDEGPAIDGLAGGRASDAEDDREKGERADRRRHHRR